MLCIAEKVVLTMSVMGTVPNIKILSFMARKGHVTENWIHRLWTERCGALSLT
jgi:hypothetical protein